MRLAAHRRVLRRPRGARVNSGGTRTIGEGN
jgi:hypothetical protein